MAKYVMFVHSKDYYTPIWKDKSSARYKMEGFHNIHFYNMMSLLLNNT